MQTLCVRRTPDPDRDYRKGNEVETGKIVVTLWGDSISPTYEFLGDITGHQVKRVVARLFGKYRRAVKVNLSEEGMNKDD